MTESAHPGDVVLADQFIDRTCHRKNSFFQDLGVVAHVGFSDPVDAPLSDLLYRCAVESGARAHKGGTYVCIEGPQFSTRRVEPLQLGRHRDQDDQPPEALGPQAQPLRDHRARHRHDCWKADGAGHRRAGHLGAEEERVGGPDHLRQAPIASPNALSPASRLANAVMTAPDRMSAEARKKLAPLLSPSWSQAPS
jgi:5'-methylthioadenosine phosphorylase